ncbi:MAG: FG-GAP repeat domain-containing protein [Gammaproteobacteria bacterium]
MNAAELIREFKQGLGRYGVLGIVPRAFFLVWRRLYPGWYRWRSGVGLALRMRLRGRGRVRLLGLKPCGYAVRALVHLPTHGLLVSADVGDDSISLIPLAGSGRAIIRFPARSAPMGLATVDTEACRALLVSTFNFDESAARVPASTVEVLHELDVLAELARRGAPVTVDDVFERLLTRPGHWGFRVLASAARADGRVELAVTDRDDDRLFTATLAPDQARIRAQDFTPIELRRAEGETLEPIGVAIDPAPAVSGSDGKDPETRYVVGLRASEQLLRVGAGEDGKLGVIQSLPAGGLSRSSVVRAHLRPDGGADLAVALWGGDPTDIDTAHQGHLAVFLADKAGAYGEPVLLEAGINPTDVVCGDFDGDGLDELAVLNYGSGLSVFTLNEPGGVQFYKWREGKLVCIAEFAVPHPRIGLAADVNGDGRDELIVSLFFDNRLAILGLVD